MFWSKFCKCYMTRVSFSQFFILSDYKYILKFVFNWYIKDICLVKFIVKLIMIIKSFFDAMMAASCIICIKNAKNLSLCLYHFCCKHIQLTCISANISIFDAFCDSQTSFWGLVSIICMLMQLKNGFCGSLRSFTWRLTSLES